MNEDDSAYFTAAIATAAQSVARKPKFRGVVEGDDIRSHLWTWVLSHGAKIGRYRTENDDEDFDRLIGFVLFDEAHIFARKEKAAALGYSTSDEFFYSKPVIEDLLGAMFDRESWLNPPTEGGNERSSKSLSEGNNWLATLSDVSNSYDGLEEKDRQVLALVFRDDIAKTKLADMWQLSRKGVDHRIEASVKRLWSALGGPRWLLEEEREGHFSGGRKAISNAHARAISDTQYEVGV